MINRVVLIGRLTSDVDLKYTQSGTAVASFSLAVQRNFKNANGEYDTDFINCQIWRKSAEALANYTHKGSMIGIEGRIQTCNYENQQGQRVYVTEVIVDNFSLLDSKNAQNNQTSGALDNVQGNYVPTTQNGTYGQNTANNAYQPQGREIDINDADLPF